jgi:ribonuclease BN (tRNA processing enzyme)
MLFIFMLFVVSGIYFEPTPGSGMLLDAGEGSYGMLYRRFGEKLSEVSGEGRGKMERIHFLQVISSIKAAWISHIHADHHLGLIRILLKRKEVYTASHNYIFFHFMSNKFHIKY